MRDLDIHNFRSVESFTCHNRLLDVDMVPHVVHHVTCRNNFYKIMTFHFKAEVLQGQYKIQG